MAILTGDGILDALLVFVSGALILFNYIIKTYTFWSRLGVYGKIAQFPYGNLEDVVFGKKTSLEFWDEQYKKLKRKKKSFGGYFQFVKPTLLVADPVLIKRILVDDFEYFKNRSDRSNLELESLTCNLVFLKNQDWKNLRRKILPIFSADKMKTYYETASAVNQELINKLGSNISSNEDIDIQEFVSNYVVDVLQKCVYGCEHDSAKFYENAAKIFQSGFIAQTKYYLLKIFPKISKFLRLKIVPKGVSQYFTDIVKTEIENRKKNDIVKKDVLQELIHLMNSSGDESLTIEEISAQAFVLFMAGYKNLLATISLALYELAKEEDCQNELRKEIEDILKKQENISYDVLLEMKYLEQVINETLRKYPASPYITRESNKLYKIPQTELTLPVGVEVLIPVYSIHNDTNFYHSPEKFNPAEKFDYRRSFTYFPFGDGARNCIGKTFAQLVIKSCLAELVKNYKFISSNTNTEPLELDEAHNSLVVKNKVLLKVEKV